jgi:hypothetical protein
VNNDENVKIKNKLVIIMPKKNGDLSPKVYF